MDAYSNPTPIATVEQFKVALRAAHISDTGLLMLRTQYGAQKHAISAAQLARDFHWASHGVANLHYGRLAHRIAEALGHQPGPFPDGNPHRWRTLSYWNEASEIGEGKEQWIMRPELAQAIQELGWGNTIA